MIWEINGVSREVEEVIAEINNDLPLPLGIVLFGADSWLKAKLCKQLRRYLDEPLVFDRQGIEGPYIDIARTFFRQEKPVLVCMTGHESIHYGLYRHRVEQLRRLGAATVVGFFARATGKDDIDYALRDFDPQFGHKVYHQQIKKLTEDPPHRKDFDYFVVVHSD